MYLKRLLVSAALVLTLLFAKKARRMRLITSGSPEVTRFGSFVLISGKGFAKTLVANV